METLEIAKTRLRLKMKFKNLPNDTKTKTMSESLVTLRQDHEFIEYMCS